MQTSRLMFMIMVSLGAMLQACGRMTDESHLVGMTRREPTKVFIVGLGGNASCHPDPKQRMQFWTPHNGHLYHRFKSLIADLANNQRLDVHFLITCHGLSQRTHLTSTLDESDKVLHMDMEALPGYVANQTRAGDHVFVIGHSYGGELGINLSYHLLRAGKKVQGLYTIDPISRANCGAKKLSLKGCTEFPSSLEQNLLKFVSTKVSRWVNFYQTKQVLLPYPLHSSSTPYATSNERFDLNHLKIPFEPTIWQKITRDVAQVAF